MENPCKNCCDRFVGCHAICEKYGSWSVEHEAWLNTVRTEKMRNRMLNEQREDTYKNIKKSH